MIMGSGVTRYRKYQGSLLQAFIGLAQARRRYEGTGALQQMRRSVSSGAPADGQEDPGVTRWRNDLIIAVVWKHSVAQTDGGFTSDISDGMMAESCSSGCMCCIRNFALFSREGNVEARRGLCKTAKFFLLRRPWKGRATAGD